MLTREQIAAMTMAQRYEAHAHALKTVRRLIACVEAARTPEALSRHVRHARLFLADATRVGRRLEMKQIDKGARAGWIRTDAHFNADRQVEKAQRDLARAIKCARCREVA